MNKRKFLGEHSVLVRRDTRRSVIQLSAITVGYVAPLYIAVEVGHPAVWLLAWLISGFVLSSLFSGIHYAAHGTIFKNRKANVVAGRIMSLFIVLNYTIYKNFHLEHHKYTNVSGDTEVAGDIKSIWHYLFYLLNWDFIYVFLKMQWRALVFREYPYFVRAKNEASQARIDAVLIFLWLILVVVAAIFDFHWTLFLYLIPLQVGWTFNYLFSLPEHYGCRSSPDVLISTRSTRLRSRVVQFFYWNSNYHAEHHLFASIPFFNLPKVHAAISDNIQVLGVSYWKFHLDLIRTLLAKDYLPREAPSNRFASFLYPTSKI